MNSEAKNYIIYNIMTGQAVARISAEGVVSAEGDSEAAGVLTGLMQQDIVVREHQIDYDPQNADEDFDAYPEENMCYFGLVTLQPGDPSYLKAFLRRLPYVSVYEARPESD